jgi:hypothetical protein
MRGMEAACHFLGGKAVHIRALCWVWRFGREKSNQIMFSLTQLDGARPAGADPMPRTLRAQMSAEESVPEDGKWTGRTGLGRSSSLRAVFKPDSVPFGLAVPYYPF